MDRRRFRNIVFQVHTWLGLHLCLLLALIFATGTLLMFTPELSYFNRSDLWTSPPSSDAELASIGDVYDAVHATEWIDRSDVIVPAPRPWFGYTVYGPGYAAHVDRASAELLGFGEESTLFKVIRSMHDSLLMPLRYAYSAVTFLSFIILIMVVTGLITYRRFWKGYFRRLPRTEDIRARRGALHRLIGIWVAPFLIASTFGSAVFFFDSVGLSAVKQTPQDQPERSEVLPPGFDGVALDALLVACQAELPTFRERVVEFPKGPGAPLILSGYDADIGPIFGLVDCVTDPAGGSASELIRGSDGNFMVNLKELATALHFGTWGGWTSQILWIVFGLGSVYLAVTGAQVYASRVATSSIGGGTQGTISTLVKGLGIFKWAYLLLVLGLCALIVLRVFS